MHHAAGLFASIEQSALGLLIRDSLFFYPAANVVHVLAVLVFFAIVAAMDLTLLGAIPGAQPFTTKLRLRPVALLAFALIFLSGLAMFVAEAAAMTRNVAFQAKMVALFAGGVNFIVLERLAAGGEVTRSIRLCAALSMAIWILAAGLGRFIAYA